MAKAAAMLAVFGFCTYLGFSHSRGLNYRIQMLKMICTDLCALSVHLRYGRLPLDQLFYQSASERNMLFQTMAEAISQGETPKAALQRAIEEGKNNGDRWILSLQKEDLQALQGFCSTLGSLDTDDQCRQIERLENTFGSTLEIATQQEASQGKLFRSLGLMAGTAFAILLI